MRDWSSGSRAVSRGHVVVGVDVDPVLVEAARSNYPGPAWLVADLVNLDLPSMGEPSAN